MNRGRAYPPPVSEGLTLDVALDVWIVTFAMHTGLALAGLALFASLDVALDVVGVGVRLRDGPLALLLRHTLSFRLPRGSALVTV
jgi:hypothetical protein